MKTGILEIGQLRHYSITDNIPHDLRDARWSQRLLGRCDTPLYTCESTAVANIIAEFICFVPEVCISRRKQLEFKGESVSVLCNGLF